MAAREVPSLFFQFFLLISGALSLEIDLGGKWTIHNANRSLNLYGNVPGSVHMALFDNGIIDDPYFRFNDVLYRWIAYDNWTYSRTFEVSEDILSKEKVVLRCDGLDTVANVSINGKLVGDSRSMFIRYVFDIKSEIKPGTNILQIAFTSAISYAAMKSREYGTDVPPNCSVPVQRGECHRNFIRKEQSSFSWDWGPAFIPQGIWRNISLEAFDTAVIRNVKVTSSKKGLTKSCPWYLDIVVILDSAKAGVCGNIYVSLPEIPYSVKFLVHVQDAGIQNVILEQLKFTTQQVKTWWPRGSGKQPLYTLKVAFQSLSADEHSEFTIRTGFRTVKLVQEPIKGSPGLGFHFEINDVPLFLKGANWIPADSFEDRVNSSVLRNLLQSAADANMNVIRNWGGGIYQHDEFYSIADELGLLVWEEFMFACSMYPTNKDFLDLVKQEVVYQVERLGYHPSVFVWSGNNENEAAIAENWYNTNLKKPYFVKEYVKLYIDTIMTTLKTVDRSRPFLASSPSNGVDSEREGWVAKTPSSPYWGDVHFYNYGMDCWNVSGYPKPRFASEYGFQSYASFETLAPVSNPGDWAYNSEFMDHRQHHAHGNKEMLNTVKMHFTLPSSSNPLKKFKDTLHIIQVAQAMCIKAETEHYRRLRSELINGQGHTMGAIYWQLNSIWQSPSWSSLEYGGKWKVLHYYAKDFFSPVISSAYEEKGALRIHMVSDLSTAITNGMLLISMWQWSSLKPLHTWKVSFDIKQQSTKMVFTQPIKEMVKQSTCPSRGHCFVTMTPTNADTKKYLGPSNTFFLSSLSDAVGMKDPQLKISNVHMLSKTEVSLSISAQAPAAFVWLSSGNVRGRFSDNGFNQIELVRNITFRPWGKFSLTQFRKNVLVTSLYELYT